MKQTVCSILLVGFIAWGCAKAVWVPPGGDTVLPAGGAPSVISEDMTQADYERSLMQRYPEHAACIEEKFYTDDDWRECLDAPRMNGR